MRTAPTIIGTATAMTDETRDIYRLSAWFSPAFPVGSYAWSSGLEYAVEAGLVTDAASLRSWLTETVRFGAGAVDGALFCLAFRAVADDDRDALAECLDWGEALRPTAELALETVAQGAAFLKILRSAWPHAGLKALDAIARHRDRRPAYPVAAGAGCGCHGLALETSLTAFLHAVAANLVSAAVRTVPLGQTDGQRVTAALEPVLAETAARANSATFETLGTSTPMADWASMRHETQHTRLFRS